MRRKLATSLVACLAIVAPGSARALTISDWEDPRWNGLTWEHFDFQFSYANGQYSGATSAWTETSIYLIEARNSGIETCNLSGQTDWSTGWVTEYNQDSAWAYGSGGYATGFWDCVTFHHLEVDHQAHYYQGIPHAVLFDNDSQHSQYDRLK